MILDNNNVEFWLRRVAWGLMTLLVIALCIYSAVYFLPGMPFSFRPDVYPGSSFTIFLLAHIGGAIIAALAGQPEDVAQTVVKAVEAKTPKIRYKVTALAKWMPRMAAVMPDRLWDFFQAKQAEMA